MHLVLAGGGHSHLFVLEAFAARPVRAARLTLVTPQALTTYTGMVPGVVAGTYAARDAQIDLRPLAARAGATLITGRVVRIDAPRHQVELSDGTLLRYDLLSLDIGATPRHAPTIAPGAPLVPVKPIERALEGLQAALATQPPAQTVVVGAGAGGIELAFAINARRRPAVPASVVLCDSADAPLSERPRASALVARACAAAGIRFVGGVKVTRVERTGVELHDGRSLLADLIVWATGAAGPPLVAQSGLPTAAHGFIAVGADLRCIAHPEVFAAGDCATLVAYPSLPKAGVFAVRQGPVLAHNLRAALRGQPLRRYRPQTRFLALLNTADGCAILTYGPLAWHGRAAWRLKDRIDRGFVRRFT